ncbi:spermatogenesis-associated protein 31D1-like [Saccopteryx bilineata]|uniref:spermatogenesis-associated protein 31D1-like n=1 Tax=Saccopteryx bilineata TaxID=59482 RepID=UPI0033906CF5
MTEPSSTQSSAFSAVPPADITPPPLPKPFPPPPFVPTPNPVTTLGNFQSPSPPGHTLPPETFPLSECKLPVYHSPIQAKDCSLNLEQCKFHQESPARHATQTSFGGDPEAKLIDSGHLLFLSPDEQDSVQHPMYPKTGEDNLKQESIQLFWGLPSPHSESLTSPVRSSDDYSSVFAFSSPANASTGPESPILPYVLPPSLPEAQPQPLPQTMPQSQSLPLTQIQPQAPLQSSLPVLPSGPTPQIRVCGVCFSALQSKSELLTASQIYQIEQNMLKKQRESVWGLPSVVQNSQKDFCLSAPTVPYCRPSKADVSISITPIKFYLSSQIQKTLEHHIRKRLIQHRWGLPLRILKILSLMRPVRNSLAVSESKSCYGHSQISMYKSPSRNNVNVGLSQLGSFYRRGSEMFHLEENKGTDERDSQEDDLKDHLSSNSHSSSDKHVGYDSHTNLDISGEHSVVSGLTASQRKLANDMEVHLNKKFKEISKGQLPGTVYSSMHAMKQTPSVKSKTGIKQTSLPPSMDLNCYLNVSQKLSFLESTTEQMLESHINRFHTRMLWGRPAKVLESVKLFNSSSHSSINSNSSSSTSLISKIKSQPGGFIHLRGGSKSLYEEKEYSATILNLPVSAAASFVGKEEQGTLTQSPSDITHRPAEEGQTIPDATQTVTNNITGKASQRHSTMDSVHPPLQPARQVGARTVNTSTGAELQQQNKRSEPGSVPGVSRAAELSAPQSKLDGLKTTESGISQMITAKTAEKPPARAPAIQNPVTSDSMEQLMAELQSKLEKRSHRQAQGQPTDLSHNPESSTDKASLTHAQGVSSADTGVSQMLHVHLKERKIRMEQQLHSKEVSRTDSQSEKFSGGDTGFKASELKRKTFLTQNTALGEMLGSKFPQTLSQKDQSPDSLFTKRMKRFFERLIPQFPRVISPGNGSPVPAQSRSPVKRRAAFTGISDIGKSLEGKAGRPDTLGSSDPRKPPPSTAKFGKAEQKAAVRACSQPVQGLPPNSRAAASKATITKSCSQAALFAGQSSTTTRYTRNAGRHAQTVMTLKDQQLHQKQCQSVPNRGTVPHLSPTCRPLGAQGPPAVLRTAKGSVLRAQNFQGKNIPTPK